MDELQNKRLEQAHEALEEARALLDAGMDDGLVLTSIYYAFYYPVIALVYNGRTPESMQSVTFGLFDQQYLQQGIFTNEIGLALEKINRIKPDCSGRSLPTSRQEMEALLAIAENFVSHVRRLIPS